MQRYASLLIGLAKEKSMSHGVSSASRPGNGIGPSQSQLQKARERQLSREGLRLGNARQTADEAQHPVKVADPSVKKR